MEMVNRLGLEYISVFGLSPVQFVHLAADLGCANIGTGLAPLPYNPHGYPAWSLLDDRALRRETVAALRERGVTLASGEGILIWPDRDVRASAAALDALCELGARRLTTLSIDTDRGRSFDQLAALVEMAAAVGLETQLEFGPCMGIADLPTALAAIHHVARPELRLLIDTMHFIRSGATVADLRAVDPQRIGYAQLCDVPRVSSYAQYMDEARYERLPPGDGELPLAEIVAALPPQIVIGLEVPRRALAEAGVGPRERLRPCVQAARLLLGS